MSSEIITQPSSYGFMQVKTLEQAMECAELVSKTSFCPKQMLDKPGDIVIALQMGQELGLKPMQALQNIAVINGRPSVWGDAMLAVCRQSASFEFIKEEYLEPSNAYVCRVKRKNEPEFIQSFSEKDARLAKLWGKQGPWTEYPRRMLQMRARGFCLRDAFPDLLRGILTTEEAMDMPKEKKDYSNVGVTIEHKDSAAAGRNVINPEQLQTLKQMISEAEADEQKICVMLEIDSVEQMLAHQFYQICGKLEKQAIKKRAKKKEIETNNTTKNDSHSSEEDVKVLDVDEKVVQEWLNS